LLVSVSPAKTVLAEATAKMRTAKSFIILLANIYEEAQPIFPVDTCHFPLTRRQSGGNGIFGWCSFLSLKGQRKYVQHSFLILFIFANILKYDDISRQSERGTEIFLSLNSASHLSLDSILREMWPSALFIYVQLSDFFSSTKLCHNSFLWSSVVRKFLKPLNFSIPKRILRVLSWAFSLWFFDERPLLYVCTP
jgi:hypothetical protein